jgi:hypothetical protein
MSRVSAVSMHLELGSTRAPGVTSGRPRRGALQWPWSPNDELVLGAHNVAGEGVAHNARGGRAPSPPEGHGSKGSLGPPTESSRKQRISPIVTLLLLSPVIGEVMSGATRLSYIFVLVPEIMVWGCGALLIREVVRRWQGGWSSMLLLGLGLSIAEEFLIQQTSIAPLPWLGTAPAYGRVWGVNWPYFQFMLGYEAIWIVLVPVQLTELIFPERRHQPWLRARGILVASAVFLIGSFIAWFSWTQQARPLMFHVGPYHPPVLTLLIGVVAIALLAASAYLARRFWRTPAPGRPPRPWVVATTAILLGLPWYILMVLVFVPPRNLPLLVPVALALVWATGAVLLIKRWSLTTEWWDLHRWALCFGALLVCMTGGFLGAGAWPIMDTIAKAVLNVIAILCMASLALHIKRRPAV